MSSLTTLDKPIGVKPTRMVRIVDAIHSQQMKHTATVVDPKTLMWNGETTYELDDIYEDKNIAQMFGQNISGLVSSYFSTGVNVSLILIGETRSPIIANFYDLANKVSDVLFNTLNRRNDEDDSTKNEVRVSMIDIKNEVAVDLINENGSVEIAEDEIRGTTHTGRRVTVSSHSELMNALQKVSPIFLLFILRFEGHRT
jgi:hypothetical protein